MSWMYSVSVPMISSTTAARRAFHAPSFHGSRARAAAPGPRALGVRCALPSRAPPAASGLRMGGRRPVSGVHGTGVSPMDGGEPASGVPGARGGVPLRRLEGDAGLLISRGGVGIRPAARGRERAQPHSWLPCNS